MYEYLKFNLGANNLDELNELGRARWCCVCSISRTKNHDVLLLKRELPDELNAKGGEQECAKDLQAGMFHEKLISD